MTSRPIAALDRAAAEESRDCGPGVRRLLRWLCVCAGAALGACTWLESEFSTLDRLPPAWRNPVDQPATATAERP